MSDNAVIYNDRYFKDVDDLRAYLISERIYRVEKGDIQEAVVTGPVSDSDLSWLNAEIADDTPHLPLHQCDERTGI